MAHRYDYKEIQPPDAGEKDPSEWHHSKRRAWILQNKVLPKTTIHAVNWKELSEKFDKGEATLHRDKDAIMEYLGDDIDEDRVKAHGRSLYEGFMEEMIDRYHDPEDDEITHPQDVTSFYREWVETLRGFGQIPPRQDDPRFIEDADAAVPEEIRVAIEGVGAEEFDPEELEELPEQDRPTPSGKEAETETEQETPEQEQEQEVEATE